MPQREPGWYWVQVMNRFTNAPDRLEPLHWDGDLWWSDKQGGSWLHDDDMAIIHEQRIPEPEPLHVRKAR